MKYLILGSAGQIGAALTDYLRNQNEEVIEYDLVRSPKEDLRLYPNPLLESLVASCDFVFFLAFDVGGAVYLKTYQNSYEFISNNTKIMQVTFEILRKFQKPFIFASSQMAAMSHSPYGLLKAIGDYFTHSLGGLIVKFWNVYGAEHDFKKSHVITDFILKAMKHKKIDMLTDGLEERQFLYAEDACKALYILSKNYADVSRNDPLHITNFKWTSVLDIAQIVSKHFPGTEITQAHEKDSVQLSQRNEPDPSIRKYWEPSIALEVGIEKMVAHYTARH
jgi:nucleoside-diphosphate-sugar epimerase